MADTEASASRDYSKLFDLICTSSVAVGWVDYRMHDDVTACRDVVQIKRHGEFDVFIGARGICYSSLNSFHRREGSEREVFIMMCVNLNLEWIADEADQLRAENERLRELSERNEVAAAQMSTLIRNCMVLLCGNDYERTSTFTQFEVTIETLTRYYGPNLQRKMIRREAVRAALVQLRAEMQTVDDLGLRSEAVIVDLFKTFDATMAQLGLGVEGK